MDDTIANALSYPVLSWTTFLPLAGAAALLVVRRDSLVRWWSLLVTLATFAVSLPLYLRFDKTTYRMQFVETRPWIEAWDVSYKVGVDGISLPFVFLTVLLSVLCVAVSWKAVRTGVRGFFVSLLVMETAVIGLFASMNFYLFYMFWELMLIPMFLLIGVWGGPNRVYAALKFVLFTLAGSVLMLVGMAALYHAGGGTLDILELSRARLPAALQCWLFAAFFAAFAVKVPMFPVHTWLPDAHTEAPTAGSVILAGVLLKMGAYGFLRISLPLFPDATRLLLKPMLILSVVAIIYGAYVTITQTDIKRLIAYSSVSHMGFVTLGIFSLTRSGLEGGILQMVNHGVVTGGLFLCVGILYERTHTRDIADYGGLFKAVPVAATFLAFFCLAAVGFPGLNSFVGEFLIVSGAFQYNVWLGALSIWGVALGVVYMAWLYYRVALNDVNPRMGGPLADLEPREMLLLAPLVILVLVIGLAPETVLGYTHASVAHLLDRLSEAAAAAEAF